LFRLKLQGKTFAEIQAAMSVKSLNTIYTWDHRCRKHMLELLGGTWEARR
jgi:RNA polymerase sigma-70 factor (ECF subfamily)